MKGHPTELNMGLKETLKRFEAWALGRRTSSENVSEEQSTDFSESESSSDEELFNQQSLEQQGRFRRLQSLNILINQASARARSAQSLEQIVEASQSPMGQEIDQTSQAIAHDDSDKENRPSPEVLGNRSMFSPNRNVQCQLQPWMWRRQAPESSTSLR